jgi:3,4-dihydroxy 2-butanone 4-phosphate synthase/GTP cyclohydrolase II
VNRDLLSDWLDDVRLSDRSHKDLPLVTLSYAQSLDACITAEKGKPTVLSGTESAEATHLIRSRHDGILIGVGTVLSDNPGLTVRLVDGPDPRPVVLDTKLRTSPDSKFISTGNPPLIFCGENRPGAAENRLAAKGAAVVPVGEDREGHLDILEILSALPEYGINSLMVEGGGEIINSFINSGYWDRAAITVVPRWIGGYGPAPKTGLPVDLSEVLWLPTGNDVLCLGRRVI